MSGIMEKGFLVVSVTVLLLVSCAGGKKLQTVTENGVTAAVAVGSLDDVAEEVFADTASVAGQVIEVQDLKGNTIIMNAVLDEESGEMVASEQLDEIVVEAKFRHVAERNGVVDLVFELAVPVELQKSMWQVRFTPKFAFLGDTLLGEKIYVTGERFRKVQQWEYRMYNNYLSRVVDKEAADTLYDRARMREMFLLRNGSEMADIAAGHYRMNLMEKINGRMERWKGKIYDRFVVDPYPEGGVRLDSVVYNPGERQVRYFYVQTIATRANLKRVDMVMEGEVHTNGRKLCTLRGTDPITFYISSISAFTDNSERYLKKIIYRDLHFETMYNIGFGKGEWRIDPSFGSNGPELASLKKNLLEILENEDYVVDSIHITAACSPEGKIHVNDKLSRRRGETISNYVMECMREYEDSLHRSVWEINADETFSQEGCREEDFSEKNIRITEASEDWETLYTLMAADTLVAGEWDFLAREEDPDRRETLLQGRKEFGYIRENLYPRLRRVKFNFKLHRKGMVKDTVHTTVLDSVYMKGVEALSNRDYKLAVSLLRPYECYNTAVAYVCMDYNNSALEILERLPRDARRDYMLAVVYGRLGNEKLAVEHFLNSVEQDDQMRHRGNLDPEISALIKKYGIFNNY